MNISNGFNFSTSDSIARIELDRPDARVNVLTAEVMEQLGNYFDEISRHQSLKALVILSRKKDIFIAGADIKEIDGIATKDAGEQKSKAGQCILNKLEDLKIPTIAVIDGACLGGGCELALACRYRVATFSDKVSIGLPEVKLGILPGFGGTYRLPRLVGLGQALKMILSGKILNSKDAYRAGLVDRLVSSGSLERDVQAFIADLLSGKRVGQAGLKKKSLMEKFLDTSFIGRMISFREAHRSTLDLTKGFYPAPLKALDVLRRTGLSRRETALNREARAFAELVITPESKNLIKLFYLSEKYKKLAIPGTEHFAPRAVEKCAVLGAGVMGGGIAQLLADKGVRVRLKDIRPDALLKGMQAARKIYDQPLKRKRIKSWDVDNKMAAITPTMDYSGFKNADMAIEAVVEDMTIKKKVFQELSREVSEQAIIGTNTSALSVTEMAGQVSNPSRVIGLHFFNPVHRMPLIEIITTPSTSPETIAATIHFVKRLGKTPILVKDSCGFLVNRILLGYINEAGRLLEEGMDMAMIDRVMTQFGMPMGPFLLSDEVGLDVGIKVLHILENGFGERFRPVAIFQKVFEKGMLGKKSGKGFYQHNKNRRPNPAIDTLVKRTSGKKISGVECRSRMLYIMVNEAARCLEEKIIDGPDAVDMGMIMGTGFPPFRGGLLTYADNIGVDVITDALNRMTEQYHAERFKPCPYLLELLKNKKSFYHA